MNASGIPYIIDHDCEAPPQTKTDTAVGMGQDRSIDGDTPLMFILLCYSADPSHPSSEEEVEDSQCGGVTAERRRNVKFCLLKKKDAPECDASNTASTAVVDDSRQQHMRRGEEQTVRYERAEAVCRLPPPHDGCRHGRYDLR